VSTTPDKSQPQGNGKIRRGQKKPYRKSSNAVLGERIASVICFLERDAMATDAEIKAFIKEQFNVEWRQAFVYMQRAREEITKRANMSKDKAREIVVSSLLHKIKHGSDMVSLRALEQLAKIIGLYASAKLELTGAEGGPIATKEEDPFAGLTIEELKKLANISE
jgi:hypothetical protein